VRELPRNRPRHGITAVPTFVINGQWAIPGAQDPETFVNVLRRLGEKLAAEAVATAGADDRTTDDACDV
jgi:predicted DsbA family dithiol-disulfide isomerase